MALRIKKNDTVYVLSGKDRGRTGRVLMVMPDADKALVEGINLVSKHERRRSQTQQGGIVSKEAPIPMCKLMLVDQKGNGKPSRVRMEERDGKKVRVIVKTGNEV